MTKTRGTKQALLMSVLALIMCVSMLVGSTMAWFTDSVTSTGNKIQAGTLKLDLELFDGTSYKSIKESKAPIFDYDKWEPGYTDVKLLKIENEGTLALKWYAKFVSDVALTDLADVIDVYVCPSATELAMPTDRNLDGYTKVGTVRDFVNTIETTTNGVLNGLSSAYLGIALKMQETAGNEYQDLTIGAFDILILATQATVEEDIFNNQYDADAKYPFELWDGTTVTPPVKDADGVYHITNAAELVAMMNDSKYPNCNKYQNVVLENNIDLGGRTVSGFGDDSGFFDGIFDGQGYTISNFKIDASNRSYYAGLFNQVSQYSGENTVIKNLTVANATIIGTSQVGAIVGGMNGNTVVDNCKAIDCALIGVKKVGAVVGYTAGGTVTNNYAENCTVLYSEKEGEEILGYENTGSTVNNNTANNVTVTQGVLVATTDALINAIKNAPVGKTTNILLADGTYAGNIDITVAAMGKQAGDVVIKAASGAKPVLTGTVTLGYYQNRVGAEQWKASVAFDGITFDQAKNGEHCISVQSLNSVTFTNCTIIGDGEYGLGSQSGNNTGASLISNCTFIDAAIQGYGNFCTDLVIEKSTFNNSRINIGAGNGVTVQDCTFNVTLTEANDGDGFYVVRTSSTGTPITVKGCEINVDSTADASAAPAASKAFAVFHNRNTTKAWTIENVEINLTAAAQAVTALKPIVTAGGTMNVTNMTVNGVQY